MWHSERFEGRKKISHAKAQRRKGDPLETRQRFAALRLCVRDLLATGTFRKAGSTEHSAAKEKEDGVSSILSSLF